VAHLEGWKREFFQLLIVSGEITMALRRWNQARTFISQAIRYLSPRAVDGASYAEQFGRAHMVSVQLNS
jgi:hypothetical protein